MLVFFVYFIHLRKENRTMATWNKWHLLSTCNIRMCFSPHDFLHCSLRTIWSTWIVFGFFFCVFLLQKGYEVKELLLVLTFCFLVIKEYKMSQNFWVFFSICFCNNRTWRSNIVLNYFLFMFPCSNKSRRCWKNSFFFHCCKRNW